ncbi:MAG: flagellar biosynthetic protein FliR [Desulfobacterales bacterium]|nr:flagellar biosynthetic protein FliR [Desulfobacterales bacterium]MDJ0882574.1 flagellar biosynthetic protein FliR [Desulfobacterales bacterium]
MLALRIPFDELMLFFMVLVRVVAIFAAMPVFSSHNLPNMIKAGLALAIALAVFPALDLGRTGGLQNWGVLTMGVMGEVLLGACIGLLVRILFAGVQLAGQIAGYQMGLAIANIMDPATSLQIPILAQAYNLLAMLIFLTIDAHHWFFRSLVDSFTLLPLFEFRLSASIVSHLVDTAGAMFVIAVKIGAPVIVVLLLTSVAFGLLARTVPQMNIFIVAMPLKIVVGLVFVILSLPYLRLFMVELFQDFGASLNTVVRMMGP